MYLGTTTISCPALGKKGKNMILCPQWSGGILCIQQKSKEIVCNKKVQIRYGDFLLRRIVMLEIG